MKTRLISFLFALIAGVGIVCASDIEVDGIWYDFDDDALTATVTFRGSSSYNYSGEYTGDITIPESVTYNAKTYSVTSIGNEVFAYCTGLTSATIPNSVTSIGTSAFYGCSSLSSVTIPNSVTSIEQEAFSYCSGLTSVTIPNSVTSIGVQAFAGCSSLTSIIVETGNTIYDSRDNCNAIIETATNTLIAGCQSTIIPNSVTSIGVQAFADCSSLTSVTIPNSVTSIGSFAFQNCSGLTSITCQAESAPALGTNAFLEVDKSIPLYVPSGSIAAYQAANGWNAFANIQAISVQIGDLYYNLDADNLTAEVTYQEYGTSTNYSSLTSANIPSSVTYSDKTFSVTSIGGAAFYNCYSLTSVTISNSVTSIGGAAFSGCSNLTSVTIPNSVTSIGNSAFRYCGSLTSIDIPNSVTSIEGHAFDGCSSLTSIIVETGNTIYDSRDNCNAIIETATNTLIAGCQSTIIPNSVTSIGEGAFYNCTGLTSVTIPNSVTSIGSFAFQNCSGLTSITCQAESAPALGTNAFYNVDKSIPLYVPSGSIAAYQAAYGWSEFTNIQAIPSGGGSPMFPGDPGTITYKLQLGAAVIDGDSLPDYTPTGAGGYPQGSEVTVTAQDIPGYQFVQWSDSVTDQSRTVVVNESMTLTALYSHSMIEIAVAANRWTFICLPPLGDRQYTEEMFTYDGLTGVKWGTYSGTTRASGKSGWVTPETFNALQGYIIYSTTAGTLRINAYQDDIRQGQSSDSISTPINAYDSYLPENAGWNFLGNPYAEGFDIAGFAKAGIESPITVWNGTGYDTYTPGIDTYILQPFEAFFIQKAEGGAETIPFNRE